jgi:sugar/nucleoside kinase (ribokinase family)
LAKAPVRRFRVAVIGEIRIDIRTKLLNARFKDLSQDHLAYAPIDLTISGTAINFAQSALDYFAAVELIAKIGQDSFTPLITAKLDDLGVTARLAIDADVNNGFVIILHEALEDDTGMRLMVGSAAHPAMNLNVADVTDAATVLSQSDALFIDGYALLYENSAQAICAAAEIARAADGIVCFDLVPHDIHRRVALTSVLPVLELADVIISQAATLEGLFDGIDNKPSQDSMSCLTSTVDDMTSRSPLWIVRSGPHSVDLVSAYHRGQVRHTYRTGYKPGMASVGFGDRLTACELYWLLSARKDVSHSLHVDVHKQQL